MKVKLGISNRHVHLCEQTYKYLFNDEYLTNKRNLTQVGQFASTKVLNVIVGNKRIENVRIVGTLRDYDQVELLESDLDDNLPPRCQSGELDNSFPVTLEYNGRKITLEKGLILATRHVHMDKNLALTLGLKHNDKVYIYKDNKFYFDALIKESANAFFELHIDKDEAKEFDLQSGDEMDIRLK